ncbi:MAG: hypothetical protein QOC66_4163 [Pseudonocardiales bacterium]|jgi:hypothetical protein|nr:hypothetical protein [Pseudonocardiales bacterium]
MAKYLVLIYGDAKTWADASEAWQRENSAGHEAFNAAAGSAVLGGNELQPATQAVTLRVNSAGRPTPTDGPFLETKEVLGGYYLLEAADLDAAIELAGRIPEASAPSSAVEIRPVKDR